MSIGQRLKTVREHYRMTQAEFAEKLDVKQSYLSFVEGDKRKPSDSFLDSLYSTYKINSEWILKGTGPAIDGEPVEFQTAPSKQLTDTEALKIILMALMECMDKSGEKIPFEIQANMIVGYYKYFADADKINHKEIKKHIELTFNTLYEALKVQNAGK